MHSMKIISIFLNQNHFLFYQSLVHWLFRYYLWKMIVRLTLCIFSFKVQRKVEKVTEFILFANMKHILVIWIFIFIENCGKSGFLLTTTVNLEETIVKQSRNPLSKLILTYFYWLILLNFSKSFIVNDYVVKEGSVIITPHCNFKSFM